jgi:ABC-type phosphate transport system substrate-binding protein
MTRLFTIHARLMLGLSLLLAAALARADVVPVVSARSAVMTLSRNEVADIFLGRRARYPNGSSAVPIDQSEGSQARTEFYNRFADMTPAQLKAFWAKVIFTGRGQPPQTAASARAARKLVAANQAAIAYIDRSLVDSSVRIVRVR